VELSADDVALISARVFADTGLNLTTHGLNFQFGSEMLGVGANATSADGLAGQIADFTGRGVADVSIVRNSITECSEFSREDDNAVVVGDIIFITVGNEHLQLDVEFFFDLPMNKLSGEAWGAGLCEESDPVCAWWDGEDNTWQTHGCRSLGTTATQTEEVMQYACTHLTDFTVIVHEREGGCVSVQDAKIYEVIGGAYVVVAVASLVQLVRLVFLPNGKKLRGTVRCNLYGQHSLIFLAAVSHFVSSLRMAGAFKLPAAGVAMVTGLPWCFTFWIFSLAIYLFFYQISGKMELLYPKETISHS
jgi:hypothetical protein